MHEYLMEVEQFFGGKYRFQVNASSREEAMENGRKHIKERHNDNFIKDTLKVVKKLKPSFGKS